MTDDSRKFSEKRRYPRHAITLVLEYWDTYGSRHGGHVGNVSRTGLLIYSVQNMPIGRELNLRVFFSNGYKLESFEVLAKVIWKEFRREVDWQEYKYGLEFVRISQQEQRKLIRLLNNPPPSEDPCQYLLVPLHRSSLHRSA